MRTMFNKIKKPVSLNSVSNVIKGSKDDLTPPLNHKNLSIEMISQYGLPQNSILAMDYDATQSLLAISTKNEIRVIGQSTVEVVFELNSPTPITWLKFVKGIYLVAISSNSNITILSLHSKKILASLLPPGTVACIELDPSLDWLIIGLNNGSLSFLDVDRLHLAPLRVDNLQKKVLPKEKLSPVLNIEWHPRDIGTILVTYSHCAILYSLTTGEIKASFVYHLTKGCKGFDWSLNFANNGKKKMFGSQKEVISEILESHFHPNGLHIVTVHRDNSLVFWDATGELLQARTLFDLDLHKPGQPVNYSLELFIPINRVKWICGSDPELTKLIIIGGNEANMIYIFDFGFTLKYSLTSYDKQSDFYSKPQNGFKNIPIEFYENRSNYHEFLVDILTITDQPYFNGGFNPSYFIVKSNLQNIYLIPLEGDLGKVLLPPSIAFIHPPVTYSNIESIKRIDWYSVQSSRISSGVQAKTELLLKGGAAVNESFVKPMGNNDTFKKILITGHQKGIVRLLDITRGEVNEQEGLIQISLKETLVSNTPDDLNIVSVSCGFEARDVVIGLGNGNLVFCKFGKVNAPRQPNPPDYLACPTQHANNDVKILNIRDRIRGSFASSSTFLPSFLMTLQTPDKITSLKTCNIGFVAAGYKSGKLVVCDIGRGPAVIYNIENIVSLVPTASKCHATSIEFSIMEYGNEGYSSILMIVGTNEGGNLLYFKILPQLNGGFDVVFVDKTIKLNYKSTEDTCIKQIIPINSKTGQLTTPSMEIFNKLSRGIVIPGYVLTCSDKDLRILKPPKQKLSHKVVDEFICDFGIINTGDKGVLLSSVLRNGFVKFSSLPSLSDIVDYRLSKDLIKSYDFANISQAKILPTGEIYIKFGTEFINLSTLYDSKVKQKDSVDLLFNENAVIPPRPVMSALQWAKGNSAITTEDLNLLIAGPNRKPPKTQESQLAHNISPEANPQNTYGYNYGNGNNSSSSLGETKGYKEPVRKGAQGKANFGTSGFMRSFRDGIDTVEETFNGYANDMSESMNDTLDGQKKAMYSSAFKSKFGF